MQNISFDKITLQNGLEVILHENHSTPITAINVWYHVGSKNESPGKTGFAHLFEHIMFEGSKHHNSGFFEPLEKAGADLNGSTTPDRTNYWETVPSNYLETALWLESDRMGFLLEALDQKRFDIQKDVVKNERRQSYENRPYGQSELLLNSTLFPSPHPYNWPTIGSQEDLDNAKLDDVKDFFREFYAPSNASLVIAGDFEKSQTIDLVEKYFSSLPPGKSIDRIKKLDTSFSGRIELFHEDKVQLPRMNLSWPTIPEFDQDEPALDILGYILSEGRQSRLQKALVYDLQIARSLGSYQYCREIAGQFEIEVTANDQTVLPKIEDYVFEQIELIKSTPPSEQEITTAKNKFENILLRRLEKLGGFGGVADLLNHFNVFAKNPNEINLQLDRYQSVTAEDIQRVAKSYLNNNHVRMLVMPENSLKDISTNLDRSKEPEIPLFPDFTPPTPIYSSLENGLKLLVLEKHDSFTVGTTLLLHSGSKEDPTELPGLGDLTNAMILEGTSKKTAEEISIEMDHLGDSISRDITKEYSSVSTTMAKGVWDNAIRIMAEVIQDPSFPPEELERIKSERLTDLNRITDSPVLMAQRAIPSILHGSKSPYGHPTSGDEVSIASISRDDLIKFHKEHYDPQNTTIVVVGNITSEEVFKTISKHFSKWKTPNHKPKTSDTPNIQTSPDSQENSIFLIDKPDAPQSVILSGQLLVPRHHQDFHAITLANSVLGGQFTARLNSNLREDKGYSYGYLSQVSWGNETSTLIAGGSVQATATKESVEETLKEFTEICSSKLISSEELEDSRDSILRGMPSSFETTNNTLQRLISIPIYNLETNYYSEFVKKIKLVSLEDVHRVVQQHIMPNGLKIVIAGDKTTILPKLSELGLPITNITHNGEQIN